MKDQELSGINTGWRGRRGPLASFALESSSFDLFTSRITVHSIYLNSTPKMTNQEPTVLLSHLHRTDGSATFSQNGYTVIGSVNGPIEVQRRDELPEEAAVDVTVRPAAGVGG